MKSCNRGIFAVFLCVVAGTGCGDNLGVMEQAAAGPGDVAVMPSTLAGQLDVSWSPVSAPSGEAWKFYVYQGADIDHLAYTATVLNDLSYAAVGLLGGSQYCFSVVAVFPDNTMSDPSVAACGEARGQHPGCQISVSRVAGIAMRIDIASACDDINWSLNYRLLSSISGLAMSVVRDHPCGAVTHAEMLLTAQLPLADLVATGWLFNGTSRVDCTVSGP